MDSERTRLRVSQQVILLSVNLPAAKSILSNGILIINLCFALSIYCLPDGEFLNNKNSPPIQKTMKFLHNNSGG